MDSSMLDAAIDDGSDSDGFVPTVSSLRLQHLVSYVLII